jgi:Domain of Unknown Function (DUF1080)
MDRRTVITAGTMLAMLTAAGCAHRGSDWVTLVDGDKGLDNFNRIGDANWRAEGGAIVADKGKGGYLVTKNPYKDFEIYAEFWAETTTNSGIFIRATDPNKLTATNAYEVNIFDQRPEANQGTGGIPNFASVTPPYPKAAGKWNTYEIYAKGPVITVKLNGAVTVSIEDRSFASGPFALQYGNRGKEPGGAIKWRKVQVREL